MECLWNITAQFPMALYTCSAYSYWNVRRKNVQNFIAPLGMLNKRCVSAIGKNRMGLKKRALQEVCTVIGNCLDHCKYLYEVARKLKGPLTREWAVKISWKSRRLTFRERSIDWYHFQPNLSRWTVPLNYLLSHTHSFQYLFSLMDKGIFFFNELSAPHPHTPSALAISALSLLANPQGDRLWVGHSYKFPL